MAVFNVQEAIPSCSAAEIFQRDSEPMKSLVEKPESFGVHPTLIRESTRPFGGTYTANLVPMRFFDPVQEFSQVRAHIFRGAVLQQGGGYAVIRQGPETIEQCCVAAETVGINVGAAIDVGAMRPEPIEILPSRKSTARQMTKFNWVIWSSGRLTSTSDIRHGTFDV
ncbi:MAG TPA: hypothetical protein VGK48_04460 [Terriglobia bacterium]